MSSNTSNNSAHSSHNRARPKIDIRTAKLVGIRMKNRKSRMTRRNEKTTRAEHSSAAVWAYIPQ